MNKILLTGDGTCKKHDAFVKAQQFIKDAVKDNEAGLDNSNSLFKSFEDGQSQVLTAEDLCLLSICQSKYMFCCLENRPISKIADFLTEIQPQYFKNFCQNKINIIKLIPPVFNNVNAKVNAKNNDGSFKCSGTTVYTANEDCESSLDGNSKLEAYFNNSRLLSLLRVETQRILATQDAVIVPSGGVNIFISSPTDSSINSDGTSTVDFSDIETSPSLTSSSFKLVFGTILALVAILN